jgi:hypothetical protein
MTVMTRILIGAAAGAAATFPMTLTMEALHQALPGEPPRPLPPREVVEGIAAKAGVSHEVAEEEKQELTLAAHFGYGAACGALFALVAPRGPAAVPAGIAFGLGVWASSYLGLLPALGIRQHAKFDPVARSGLMIAAHIVWGAAAGTIVGASATQNAKRQTQDRRR